MASLAWLTRSAPSSLAAAVAAHGGHQIFEAIAVSEVLALMERLDLRVVVVDSAVEEEAARELQHRFITLRLQPGATAGDVLWELSGIFAGPSYQ